MKRSEFMQELLKTVKDFDLFWQENSDTFPDEMNMPEWWDQFESFLSLREVEK